MLFITRLSHTSVDTDVTLLMENWAIETLMKKRNMGVWLVKERRNLKKSIDTYIN